VEQRLPGECKALSLVPSTEKKKTEKVSQTREYQKDLIGAILSLILEKKEDINRKL
jgi:hypothetical protein